VRYHTYRSFFLHHPNTPIIGPIPRVKKWLFDWLGLLPSVTIRSASVGPGCILAERWPLTNLRTRESPAVGAAGDPGLPDTRLAQRNPDPIGLVIVLSSADSKGASAKIWVYVNVARYQQK